MPGKSIQLDEQGQDIPVVDPLYFDKAEAKELFDSMMAYVFELPADNEFEAVMWFLRGRSKTDIAREMNLSLTSVVKYIQEAIEDIKDLNEVSEF